MTGNSQGSGLQVANMQYQPRVSNYGSCSKGVMYNNKSSRMSRTEDRPNPRQVSRATSYASSSGSRSTSRSKSLQNTSKSKLPSLPDSPTDEKFHHVPTLSGCRNVMHCFSGSSDDSGSDADIEIGLDINHGSSVFPTAPDVAFQRHRAASCQGGTSASTSSQSSLLSIDTNMRKGNTRFLSGRLGNQAGEKLNWSEHHGYCTSDAGKTREAGSTPFPYGPIVLEETEPPCSSVKAPNNSVMASHLNGCQCGNEISSSMKGARKARIGAETICNCKVESNGDSNVLHGKYITNKAFSHFRGLNLGRQDSTCKRRNCAQGVLGDKPVGATSNGSGFRGSNDVGFATNSSRRNLSNLSCSSSTDVLPSVPFDGNPDRPRCVKAEGPNSASNKSETIRGLRSGKNPVSAIAVGCLAYRNSRDGSVGASTERSSSKGDSVSVRPIRRSGTVFQSDIWCPRTSSSVEQDTMISSGTSTGAQLPLTSRGCRGGSPLVSRGRTVARSSARFGEHVFGTAVTYNERPSQRCAASSSRVTSAGSSSYTNQFGAMGVEIRNPMRNRTDSGSSSSSMGSFTLDDQETPSSSTFSGPPPSRPPPPSPGLVSNQQLASYNPPPSTSPYLSNPRFPQSYAATSDRNHLSNTPFGPRFTRLGPPPEDQYERHHTSVMESLLWRPSHEAQVQSVGESQPRLMMEGLSEILTALEHVERDEELSYEQILMLEATILLGGMGLHDRYRDMRLDVDNMSYEELLALEEQIGSVSTGLSEDAIAKCMKRSRFTSLNVSVNYVPQEVEVKCSVCQEEFVENVDLGILECGHVYHVACIKQWLLQKNQCPICKASAVSQP